jgi:formamidopyrimidine-DNA glycosylase
LITGKTFQHVTILSPRSVEYDPDHFSELLKNKTIKQIGRKGKYICLYFDDEQCLTIHLRMTGKLVFEPTEKDKNYIRVIFEFTDGFFLYFVDTRKFGRIKFWPKNEILLPRLGPDPMEENTIFLVLSKLKSRRAIKSVLLDQEVLAGVGNIYADEALFKSGIHPLTPAYLVSKIDLKKLSRYLPEILKMAIKNNGTSFSNFRRTGQLKGENQFALNVYGRTGQPCRQCETPIKRIRINNRSSHFCPKCQPGEYD